MTEKGDYIVYVDESGDHGLKNIDNNYPIFVLTFWDVVAVVGIAHILERLYRIHQIRLLCDHQELACTPEDPP